MGRLKDWWYRDPQVARDKRWEQLSAQPKTMGGNALNPLAEIFTPGQQNIVTEVQRQAQDQVQNESGAGNDVDD